MLLLIANVCRVVVIHRAWIKYAAATLASVFVFFGAVGVFVEGEPPYTQTGTMDPTIMPFPLRTVSVKQDIDRAREYVGNVSAQVLHSLDMPWLSHPKLPRGLTLQQYKEGLELLRAFSGIMDSLNVSYVMSHGTLLGSFMSHGIIPWDDDFDFLVSYEHHRKVILAFRQVMKQGKYELANYKQRNVDFTDLNSTEVKDGWWEYHKFKFFYANREKFPGYDHSWPFIDVVFYKEDDTTIWSVEKWPWNFSTKKEYFYPTHRRPFGNLWLPAPRDTRSFLRSKFSNFRCASHTWNHTQEKPQTAVDFPCHELIDYYPYVLHSDTTSGTLERLVYRESVLHSVLVEEPFDGDEPFTL